MTTPRRASAPVDLVDAEGGFVAAGALLNEVPRAAVDAGAAVASAAAPPVAPGPMRWNNNTSGPDKVFKDKDVNLVAKHLKEYNGEAEVDEKWARISKLKDLSGALWDSDVNAIMLEGEHYLGHYKDHPKDAEFLNYPIRFYIEMEAIFGHAMAIGRFAQGFGEALGVNHADSVAAKAKGTAFNNAYEEKTNTKVGEGKDAVNNVANALREIGPAHVDANLYLAVMETPGFSEEALIVAYTYLLDNKIQGRGFVGMSDSHRDIWLRNFLANNYYM
ncbi:unnamed protein product [Miscanthus lutarioriparius]|uniref:Uncharacterized protein n=1 Tax=Miscanthus lutarioriparius TaxID=422564 RepID=A0A811NP65_9POAL|nr:unnamed protein product [Miscanthus lutarioriparius]